MRVSGAAHPRWGAVSFESGGEVQSIDFKVLDRPFERLAGLLGTRRGDARSVPCLLVRCPSIHTLGMAYGIDVALVSEDGLVLRTARNVPPGRVVSHHGAAHALERPSSNEPWPSRGQVVTMQLFDVI